jgi:hypothetical protein
MADILINQPKGRIITREIVVALKDYVQWFDQEPGSDWVELPVDIPTRNLRINVFVDRDLYQHSRLETKEIPHLDLEFRNRESARFSNKEIAHYSEDPIEERWGLFPDKQLTSRESDLIHGALDELKRRFDFFSDHQASNGEVLDNTGRSLLESSLVFPKEFLFYQMTWPAPHLGMEVCVGWEKPVKGTGTMAVP